MTTTLSTAARNAAVSAVTALVDAGTGAGVLRIYTGSQPAAPDAGATGTLLVTFNLNDPAFEAVSAGSALLDVTPSISAIASASGTAGYFRISDSAGFGVIDGSVGTSGAQLNLSTTTIASGGTVTITSGSLSQPTS